MKTNQRPRKPLPPHVFEQAKAIRRVMAKYGSMSAAIKAIRAEQARRDAEEVARQRAELNSIWPGKPAAKGEGA